MFDFIFGIEDAAGEVRKINSIDSYIHTKMMLYHSREQESQTPYPNLNESPGKPLLRLKKLLK